MSLLNKISPIGETGKEIHLWKAESTMQISEKDKINIVKEKPETENIRPYAMFILGI